MATFTQRRLERELDFLATNCTDSELDQLIARLQTRKPKNNDCCTFLRKLPPEVRNIIYDFVATDAHTTYHESENAIPCYTGKYTRELGQLGRITNVPGLLGTCRDIFLEFHSVFYGAAFWELWSHDSSNNKKRIENPALIDVIVNTKHEILTFHHDRIDQAEQLLASVGDDYFKGIVFPSAPAGLAKGVGTFHVHLDPPFNTRYARRDKPYILWDCRSFREGNRVLEKIRREEKCSVCLVSQNHRIEQEKRQETENNANSMVQWEDGEGIVGVDV